MDAKTKRINRENCCIICIFRKPFQIKYRLVQYSILYLLFNVQEVLNYLLYCDHRESFLKKKNGNVTAKMFCEVQVQTEKKPHNTLVHTRQITILASLEQVYQRKTTAYNYIKLHSAHAINDPSKIEYTISQLTNQYIKLQISTSSLVQHHEN